MAQLNPYLSFDGNCHEAMNFYKEALDADLELTMAGESAGVENASAETRKQVMHSSLKKDGAVILFASDMIGPEGAKRGNTISLCLNFDNEAEITSVFKNLAEGGTMDHELKKEFWGDTYGEVTDKFGMRWLVNYHQEGAQA